MGELYDCNVSYCEKHPEERFWQALRNWSGWGFVLVTNIYPETAQEVVDTFYWGETKRPSNKEIR